MAGESNLPTPPSSRLDRSALERVLARAAELQVGTGDNEDVLSEEQIVELGKEVPDDTSGVAARLFGGSRVAASRTVRGQPRDVLAAVDGWMQRQECLQVKRQFADRIVWEARRDLVGAVRRAFNVGGRGYALSRAHDVAATAVAVDEGRTLVHLDADLGAYRSSLAKQTAGLSALGVVSTGAMIALGFMVPIAVVPAVVVSAGSFYGARGMNARVLSAAQLALEQLLDTLERGELTKQQPSLLNMLAAAASTLPRKY
jgi:hypothetical protein